MIYLRDEYTGRVTQKNGNSTGKLKTPKYEYEAQEESSGSSVKLKYQLQQHLFS